MSPTLLAILAPPLLAADAPAPVPGPGVTTPPVEHVTTDPLLPQKYRTVKAGTYPCSVVIKVAKDGKATDVEPVECDQDAFYALATAVLQWEFDPGTKDGVAVDADLPYSTDFEVKTLLPRANVVGFVGGAASVGGAGDVGAEGRIHLGERISFSLGVDIDHDTDVSTLADLWTPVIRGDFTLSSRRQRTEHRGIYGMTIGGFGDQWGSVGTYFGFRGELMTPLPGLSIGGDAGLATLWGSPSVYEDVGFWPRTGSSPFLPWLRASLIWYAPVPRDQFVVVPRPDDPVVYEAVIPEPEPVVDRDGAPFPGIRGAHWSEIEPSFGENTPTGPGFDLYPPGTYPCNVRAAVNADGQPVQVRVEKCPAAGRADALANVQAWEWPHRPGGETLQSVFPAPIFVRHDDALLVHIQSVTPLVNGEAAPLPTNAATPQVWARTLVRPDWGQTRPTRACSVDVDLDATGAVLATKWAAGDIEVMPRVMEALRGWAFYPVAIDGELAPARVRLSMCDTLPG